MSKTRNIIILFVVLGILVGTYFLLANKPGEEPEDLEEKIAIMEFDKNNIRSMTIENEHGKLVFHKIDKEVEEEKDGKKEKVQKSMWEVESPHEIIIDQMKVDDIAYSFANLEAERVIEEETPDDLGPYGLKDPQATARATLFDGSEKLLFLGNMTPSGSTYYLMVDGDPRVYEVWMNHGENFSYSLSDVRDRTLPAVNPQELIYLMVDRGDGRPIEIKQNEGQSEDEAQFGIALWQMTRPYSEPMGVDDQALQEVLGAMPNLTIEEFIEDGAEDLSKYGLSEPSMEFILKDREKTLHLLFGKEYDEDKIYFKTPYGDSVYGMKSSNVDFLHIKPFELVEKFVYIVNIDDVDEVVIEGKGKTHTLTLDRETREAQDGDEEEDIITTYRVNGKETDEKAFRGVYESIISILADGENDKDLRGNPEVKTTFYLNKGTDKEIHIDYIPYDRDFYGAYKNGYGEFLVSKSSVDKMLSNVEALVRGDSIED